MESKIADNDGTHTNHTTFDHTVDIGISPVAETDSDTNADGNTDVTLNADHSYDTHATEDTAFDLYGADQNATTPFRALGIQ